MFDFDKAIKEAKKDLANKKLFLVLLGSSGNGKSYTQGTFGVKTLYLYTQGENHGPKSASSLGRDNIVPVCIDSDAGEDLSADQAIQRLHSILDSSEWIKKQGFGAISVDGISELEFLIRDTSKFKQMTTTDSGKHNGFAEGPATLFQFREILKKLKRLQRELDIHVCMTCILNVKSYGEDGTITDSTPQSTGYVVATGLVQQFDDVMIIGKMQRKGVTRYRLQLLAEASRSTKDETGEIKKTFNFSPRLTGVDILALGSTLDANLAELIQIKQNGVIK